MNDRMNTIFGWILFSGIIALGLSSLSSKLFHTERPENLGYVIEVAEVAGAAAGPSLATLLSTADAAAGEAVFAKCTACHTIASGGANGIGPNLYGVVGKGVGKHVPGFAYSSALSGHGGDWSFENLDAWLKSPRAFADGTKMSFAGLSSGEDRANVIAYLLANGGGPALPTPEAAAPAEGEAVAGAVVATEGEPIEGAAAGGAATAENPVASSNAATDSSN